MKRGVISINNDDDDDDDNNNNNNQTFFSNINHISISGNSSHLYMNTML